MVCVVGEEFTACGGKLSAFGISAIGCRQALVLLTARQMFPKSAGCWRLPPPQAAAYTAYPAPARDCSTYPPGVEPKVTVCKPEPDDGPICPIVDPSVPMICRNTELPLISPLTDASARHG